MRYCQILLVIAAVFFATACNLDEQIFDTVVVDKIEDKQDVELLMAGIFSQYQWSYKQSISLFFEWGGGAYATTWSLGRTFVERTVTPSDAYINSVWRYHYSAIVNANSLLEQLEADEALDEGYRNRVIGELYFLRALGYFDLVRLFGPVPLRLEPTSGSVDLYLPRAPIAEVYANIFHDLEEAAERCLLFSQQPTEEFGRPTKGAAQGLLALAYLTYANQCDLNDDLGDSRSYYELAKTYADQVIASNAYSLIQDYAALWDVNNEKKDGSYMEVIFGIQFARDPLVSGQGSKGSIMAFYTQPGTRFHVTGNNPNGNGGTIVQIQPWFYDLYATGDYVDDYRTEVSFLTRWPFNATSDVAIAYPAVKEGNEVVRVPAQVCPYLNKYIDPDGLDNRNHENDFYVLRLSEVYLIKAEAENELNGPTEVAYAAFNQLRERARKANGEARETPRNLEEGLSKETFRLKVYDERGLEFIGEAKRVFDDVRMRYSDNRRTMIQYRYEDFFPSMPSEQKALPQYDAATNSWSSGRLQPTNLIPFSKRLLLWPIPSSEDANPNMTQNPGW